MMNLLLQFEPFAALYSPQNVGTEIFGYCISNWSLSSTLNILNQGRLGSCNIQPPCQGLHIAHPIRPRSVSEDCSCDWPCREGICCLTFTVSSCNSMCCLAQMVSSISPYPTPHSLGACIILPSRISGHFGSLSHRLHELLVFMAT